MERRLSYILIRLSDETLRVSPEEQSMRGWECHATFEDALKAAQSGEPAEFIVGPEGQILWRAPAA